MKVAWQNSTTGRRSNSQLIPFESWEAVLAFIKTGGWLWYHAPLDLRPSSVSVVKVYKNGKVRLRAACAMGTSFTADAGHLERFGRLRHY